jgi:hypothetical protein
MAPKKKSKRKKVSTLLRSMITIATCFAGLILLRHLHWVCNSKLSLSAAVTDTPVQRNTLLEDMKQMYSAKIAGMEVQFAARLELAIAEAVAKTTKKNRSESVEQTSSEAEALAAQTKLKLTPKPAASSKISTASPTLKPTRTPTPFPSNALPTQTSTSAKWAFFRRSDCGFVDMDPQPGCAKLAGRDIEKAKRCCEVHASCTGFNSCKSVRAYPVMKSNRCSQLKVAERLCDLHLRPETEAVANSETSHTTVNPRQLDMQSKR